MDLSLLPYPAPKPDHAKADLLTMQLEVAKLHLWQSLLYECDAYAWFLEHHVVVVHDRGRGCWCGYTTLERRTGVVLAEAGMPGCSLDYVRGYVDGMGLIARIEDLERKGYYVGGRERRPLPREVA